MSLTKRALCSSSLAPPRRLKDAAARAYPAIQPRGTAQLPWPQTDDNSIIRELSFAFYVVDSSTSVAVETDADQTCLGFLEQQGSPSISTAARARFVPTTSLSIKSVDPR